MDQPTADDNGRTEHVAPASRSKVRDALRVGVEIPATYAIGFLLIGFFNAGVVWVKFDNLVDSAKALQVTTQEASNKLIRQEQHNLYQDSQLADHELRLRTVERKTKT